VNLVDFIIRIFHDARSHERKIVNYVLKRAVHNVLVDIHGTYIYHVLK
jgi:hypothetical protein